MKGPTSSRVSSPGLERPLRTPAQFARCIGWQVDVRTASPVEGSSVHVGTLVASDDRAIEVEVDGVVRRLERPRDRVRAHGRGLGRRVEGNARLNAEMIAALRELEREKGIAFDTILQGLEEAMAAAYKSAWKQEHPDADDDFVGFRAEIDPETGEMRMFQQAARGGRGRGRRDPRDEGALRGRGHGHGRFQGADRRADGQAGDLPEAA